MLQRSLKSIQSVLLSLILITFLTSCSSVKELLVFKEEVPRAQLNLDKPVPLQMEKIKWHIITSENAVEVFAKLQADGIDPVLWGLTDKDFELLAKNFAQIRNKMVEVNAILDKYKEYYEPEQE
jgi:hypothetical protein